MKLHPWTAWLIFISSYSPLALIICIRDLKEGANLLGDFHFGLQHPQAVYWILAVALLSVAVLLLTMRSIEGGDPVKVTRVQNQSGELVNYAIPYMITFFEFDLGDGRSVAAFAAFMLLMLLLTMRTHNIFINPVLSLFRYGLYEVEYEENGKAKQATFLAKKEFWREDTCRVRRLSRFLFVVTEVNPTV